MKLPEILENRFDEYKKNIPEFIHKDDDYYGKYTYRPVILICFDYYYDGMSREEFRKIQKMVMNANTDFRKILIGYHLKSLNNDTGKDTFVIYAVDMRDNEGWAENNPQCGYIKYYANQGRVYKGPMPLGLNTDKVLREYWEKYPFTKINS